MNVLYDYETLFRVVFPEWSDEVPPLPKEEEEKRFLSSDESDDSSPDQSWPRAKYVLCEIVGTSGCSNISFRDQEEIHAGSEEIASIKVWVEGDSSPAEMSPKGLDPRFHPTSIHFVPNAVWVFSLCPDILSEYTIFDPFLVAWYKNTDALNEVHRVYSLNQIGITQCSRQELVAKLKIQFEAFANSPHREWITDYELPFARILGRMHIHSFNIDYDGLEGELAHTNRELDKQKTKIFGIAGKELISSLQRTYRMSCSTLWA